MTTELMHGDSLRVMEDLEADSVDLIMTSPPYADARAHTYGGPKPNDYVAWFLPFATQMRRIIRPTGSIVINIKEKVVDGQRHRYVLDLINALADDVGLRWVEEYVWHKSNPFPSKPQCRLKDGFERLLHFTKSSSFKFRADHVLQKSKQVEWRKYTITPDTESGMILDKRNTFGRDKAYPSNVILCSSESRNRGHSAVYPEALPAFFIKLLTDEGDLVLDPFCGSGTTCQVAQDAGRDSIGVDKDEAAVEVARRRVNIAQGRLPI